jgi:hypothetical protein
MAIAPILKLLHIITAIWVITGVIGRYVALSKAENSTDLNAVRAILPVASVFENMMVIPGSTAVLVAGLFTAWAQGWPVLGFLQGSPINWVLVSLLLFLTIIPVIVFIFVPRGKIFEARLNEAIAQNRVTTELTQAFHDPLVRAAHMYEIGLMIVIVILMVLKPF